MRGHVLATVAGFSVTATVLALFALASAPAKATVIHLPSAAAANAAYEKGLQTASTVSGVPVAIQNYAFAPAALTVPVGTKVTWTNDDTAPHTVTISSGPVTFSSPSLQKGDTYSFTFTTPGTYSYYCAVHPSMTAKVIVTGSTSTPPPTVTPTTTMPTPSTPISTPTSTMSMPSGGGSESCAISSGLQTLLTHINSAHLDESPAQQVSDILNLDTYIGNHLVLVQRILGPLTGGGLTGALSDLLSTFLTHVNTAHLDEPPAQQVSDILNINTYVGNHLALVQHMVSGFESLAC
jgi:plastocyanin